MGRVVSRINKGNLCRGKHFKIDSNPLNPSFACFLVAKVECLVRQNWEILLVDVGI